MNQFAKFWDKQAERYAKRPVQDEASYQKKLQKSREYFLPEMEVLEFGCGTGSTALLHAPFVKHILATDVSANMIQIAQLKAELQGVKNVSFSHIAFEDLNLPEASLDVVLGLNILHLLDNWDSAIVQAYSLLKPGGVFITSTHCLGDFIKVIKYVAPIGKFFGLLPNIKVFTAKELETCMVNAGFRIDYQWQPEVNKAMFMVAKK